MSVLSGSIGSMMIKMDGRCCERNSWMDGARASSEHAFQLYMVNGDGMEQAGDGWLILHAG